MGFEARKKIKKKYVPKGWLKFLTVNGYVPDDKCLIAFLRDESRGEFEGVQYVRSHMTHNSKGPIILVNIDTTSTYGHLRSCPPSLGVGRTRGVRGGGGNRVAAPGRIRVGSWNIGTLSGKQYELAEIFLKRNVDIACVQETRWKGSEAIEINDYKLWYSGSRIARNGVGIIIGKPHKDHVVDVGRFSDRIMSVCIIINEETFTVIWVYAPHAGLGDVEKKNFWELLDDVVRGCPADHRPIIGGDLNGHIGADAEGYEGAHESFGYGVRKEEGCSVIEFSIAHDLVVTNSFFKKRDAQLATFHIGGRSTQIDFLLLRKRDLRNCRDYEAGHSIVREDDIRKRWEEYFSSLFGEDIPELNSEVREVLHYQNNYFCTRINQKEVRSALRKILSNKAVGPDQIPIEAWRCLGDDRVRWLTNVFNTTFRSTKMPMEWRLSEVIPIYKNKRDAHICSNYRGIKLLSHTMKLWERVIETRLRCETKVLENQFSFMPGCSSMEAIHIIRCLMEKYREK
ncbi:uncharacterized protein [Rutidosis leptorrhynchoides]|uniref:uncharacterized protein n=1 Tax=Rutidosis leptorrhynchoides TaxID=125765 RepID=UPI003A9A20F2